MSASFQSRPIHEALLWAKGEMPLADPPATFPGLPSLDHGNKRPGSLTLTCASTIDGLLLNILTGSRPIIFTSWMAKGFYQEVTNI
eukprot:971442-Pelagomonas_calceolata.AAC.2